MSKGQYDTVKYVGQELHLALRRLFTHRQYGEIAIYHRDDETKGESLLSYSVSGSEIQMLISRTDSGYHLIARVGVKNSHHLEIKSDKDLKLKRSKEGRISHECLDDLAAQSIHYLREFHRSRQVKQ